MFGIGSRKALKAEIKELEEIDTAKSISFFRVILSKDKEINELYEKIKELEKKVLGKINEINRLRHIVKRSQQLSKRRI